MTEPSEPARVDEVDRKLLEALRLNARLSIRALSREVGMSPTAVSERISRLEKAGVIRGYRTDIDAAALGYGMQVLVGLEIEQDSPLNDMTSGLLGIPEVVSVRVVTGRWDIIIVAHVRDQDHLRALLLESVWRLAGFKRTETILVLDWKVKMHVPGLFHDPS